MIFKSQKLDYFYLTIFHICWLEIEKPNEVPVTLLLQPVILGRDEFMPGSFIWSLKDTV